MNNKIKKRLSLLVSAATVVASLSIGTVSYADESYEDSIYASSFSDYTENGTPDGWVMSSKMVVNHEEVDCDKSDVTTVYEEGHGNAARITASSGGTVKDVIPFNKVVSSGKLHISFDGKRPESSSGSKAFVTLFNVLGNGVYLDTNDLATGAKLQNYDPYNLTDFRGFIGYHASQLLRINYNDGKVLASETGHTWMTQLDTGYTIPANQWYHTDMIIDLDTHRYEVWIDGEKVTENMTKSGTDTKYAYGSFRSDQGKGAFKGLGFLQQDGNEKTGTYDNIFITHYNNDDSVKLVGEYLSGDNSGFIMNVAFSELLNRAPQNGDFIITDSYTGDKIDYTFKSADERHAVLKVSTDKAAKLNVSFNKSSGLSGTISSNLSDKLAEVYTNHTQNGTIIPVLDRVSALDYDGNNVTLDGSQIVPLGTTTVNVSFSRPMNFDDVQDKLYIKNIETGEKLNVNYTPSEDKKSVKIGFAELMSADSEYTLAIEDNLCEIGGNVSVPCRYEFSFKTSNDGGFGIFGDKIVVDEAAGTAVFDASIIKSDENTYDGTISICGYVDEEADGKTYTTLKVIDMVKYDIETKSITSYETKPIDISGLDRIKCFINDMDTHKSILITEKEL